MDDSYLEPVNIKNNIINYWTETTIKANEENCSTYKLNEENFMGSAIETRVSLDLLTLAKKELGDIKGACKDWLMGSKLGDKESTLLLKKHPKVSKVIYPGLMSGKYKKRADKYMSGGYGGRCGFELKNGLKLVQKLSKSMVTDIRKSKGFAKLIKLLSRCN